MPITELVRLLDADPDLGESLDPERRALARRHLVAEVIALRHRERLEDAFADMATDEILGLLILDGLLVRRVQLMNESGVELLASGDFIRPWQAEADLASLPAGAEWKVGEPARVAVIDKEVQATLHRFPTVLRDLVARLEQRANTLALQLALAQLPRLEARLLALLWHLADRFGRVERGGVVVPLGLSHSTLAALVYARRPSVTTALNRLAERQLLSRRSDGGITLHGAPPASTRRGTPPPARRLIEQAATV